MLSTRRKWLERVSKRSHKACTVWALMVRRERTISIKRIAVSIKNSIGRGQSGSSAISITVILSTRGVNTRSMSELMKSRGSHILGVASFGNHRQSRIVNVAVDDQVLGWKGVGESVGVACAVYVSAVLGCLSAC